MINCEEIRDELERVVDFRIGEGASKKYPLVFNKKTLLSRLTGPAIFTDGGKIYLPAQFNLSSNDSDNQMMIASAVRHESDHIREFIKLQEEMGGSEEYDPKLINRMLEDFFLQPQFRENPTLAHEIFNIVEDNRIDRKAREELPGLRHFSEEKEKPLYLSRRPNPRYLMKRGRELDAFRELFLEKTLLDKTVDEPPSKYKKLLKECVDMARSAEGKDIHASLDSTKKIYAKFKENFNIKQPMPKLPSFAGRDHGKLCPGIPRRYSGSIKPREGREEEDEETRQREGAGEKKKEMRQGGGDEERSKEKKMSQEEVKGKEKREKKENKDEEGEKLEKKGKDGERSEEVKREEQVRKEGEIPEKKISKEAKEKAKKDELERDKYRYYPGSRPFIRMVPKPSPGVYLKVPRTSNYDIKEAQRRIDKYNGEIRAIESYFRKLEERYRGKRKAKQGEEMDIREYVQAELEYEATGIRPDKKMFKKRAPVKRKAAWAVLADISASTGFGFGYRIIDYIKDALLIQGEALSYSNYPFGIFAFHSGGNSLREMINYKDTVYVIKDFGEEYTDQSRGRAMSLYPYGGTLMVNAIKYVSDNLKKMEGSPKGLSIITDGEPDIPEEVRAILDKIQKDGIFPFLFVIGAEHERYAKSLIDNYVIIRRDKINELPNEVLRIFTTYGIIK